MTVTYCVNNFNKTRSIACTFHISWNQLPRYVSEPPMSTINVICSRSQLNISLTCEETYFTFAVVAKTDRIVTCCIHCVDIIKTSYWITLYVLPDKCDLHLYYGIGQTTLATRLSMLWNTTTLDTFLLHWGCNSVSQHQDCDERSVTDKRSSKYVTTFVSVRIRLCQQLRLYCDIVERL